MGYPLTRGRVRNGVLTCDWHGWSYDMKGGGCFTGGCDDLDTFPVEVRDGGIYVDARGGGSKRKDAHFLLLKEGLLSEDNWTLSKAIAIMLAQGVSEQDALKRVVKHLGRHIATERNANDGGRELALMVNAVKVARQYGPDERLIPLMMAATGASGRAGDRPPVQPLPPPVDWPKLERWIRGFTADKAWEGIEKCLITARRLGGHDDRIVPLLYDCAVAPFFLGHAPNLPLMGYLAELLEEFGWEQGEELVCNLAAKILGRDRGAPEELRQAAIGMFEPIERLIGDLGARSAEGGAGYDEDALARELVSGDITRTFDAISTALAAGAGVDRIVTTMVLLAADRMARTPVNLNPGWGNLSQELSLAASIRTALRYGGFKVGAKALYHAAWQFFGDRWLNIPARALSEPLGAAACEAASEEDALRAVLDAVETVQVRDAGRLTREYLGRFSGDRLLAQLGQSILRDDNGWRLVHTLRVVFDEWRQCADHPARTQLIVGLVRWATDARKRAGTQSAAQTAQRFARGQTAVDLYES
jgi:hypothetical protein